MSDEKDIDRLRSSLEKLIGGRTLTRLASLKRPSVGADPATTDQKKALLNKLKGEMLLLAHLAALHMRFETKACTHGTSALANLKVNATCLRSWNMPPCSGMGTEHHSRHRIC